MKYYFMLVLFFPFQCLACSCVREPNFEKTYEAAEYVVEAKILKKSRFQSFFQNKFSLQIIQLYKGNPSQTIHVWSEKDTPACGMDFNVNEEYIIFVYSEKGKLSTSRCSVMQRIGYRSELTSKFDEAIKSKH
ncbi:MAG: hypothetical protein V4660_06155 [Pseudomonadota bacterium]